MERRKITGTSNQLQKMQHKYRDRGEMKVNSPPNKQKFLQEKLGKFQPKKERQTTILIFRENEKK